MKNETSTSLGTSAANDYDEVSRQLTELRNDMSKLVQSVAGIATRRGNGLASDIADGYEEAKHYAEKNGKSAEAQLESSVAAHPWLAIGLAASTGLLLGAMSRR